jgi:hypothetical protein
VTDSWLCKQEQIEQRVNIIRIFDMTTLARCRGQVIREGEEASIGYSKCRQGDCWEER